MLFRPIAHTDPNKRRKMQELREFLRGECIPIGVRNAVLVSVAILATALPLAFNMPALMSIGVSVIAFLVVYLLSAVRIYLNADRVLRENLLIRLFEIEPSQADSIETIAVVARNQVTGQLHRTTIMCVAIGVLATAISFTQWFRETTNPVPLGTFLTFAYCWYGGIVILYLLFGGLGASQSTSDQEIGAERTVLGEYKEEKLAELFYRRRLTDQFVPPVLEHESARQLFSGKPQRRDRSESSSKPRPVNPVAKREHLGVVMPPGGAKRRRRSSRATTDVDE